MPNDSIPEPQAPASGSEPRRWEIPVAGLGSAAFLLAFLVVPVLGPLALPFAAVPVVRTTHRRGLRAGLAGCALASALLFLVGLSGAGVAEAALAGVFALLLTALPCAATAWVRRGADPSAAFVGLCLFGFALVAGALLLRSAVTGHSLARDVGSAFDEMAPAISRSQLDPETAARMRGTLAAAREFAGRYWIGLVGASWVLGSAVAFYTGARFARPAPSAEAVRFERLRVPPAAVALFALAGGGSVLLAAPYKQIAGNVLLPLVALYFVLGLSIICHFARKWFRIRILRVGLYALIVYFPMNVGVALLGIFDWYADFRRRGEGALEKP